MFYNDGSPHDHGDDIHQKEIKETGKKKDQGHKTDDLLQLGYYIAILSHGIDIKPITERPALSGIASYHSIIW
jgi:hypothetical protein